LGIAGGAPKMMEEGLNLADWSRVVRESSLKLLRLIPAGSENWRPVPEAMSYADLAYHLLEADLWLFRKLTDHTLEPMHGHAGAIHISAPQELLEPLRRLENTGVQRSELIGGLSQEELRQPINDQRFGGEVTVWWVIVRGNLDHEAHHRGQIASYLRMGHLDAS
jgi:uncharacterized damage-inducible protein DinB